jgi:hypothetical protein
MHNIKDMFHRILILISACAVATHNDLFENYVLLIRKDHTLRVAKCREHARARGPHEDETSVIRLVLSLTDL